MTRRASLVESARVKMVLATGAEINSIFGVSPTKTIKYQLGISKQWRDEHAGQILVSGKPFSG